MISKSRVDCRSVTGHYFDGRFSEDMDRLVPNSPIIITHNDALPGRTFLFLNREWLDAVKREAATYPFQPWDTRLSIYSSALEISSRDWTILQWRPWRNSKVPIPPGPQGDSDIAMTWSSVDTQLLNAVCRILAKGYPLKFGLSITADLVAPPIPVW